MRKCLNRFLHNNPDLSWSATKAFTDWPALEQIAIQFLYYVSPWLIVREECLADITLRNALMAYGETSSGGYEAGYGKFIERIAKSAYSLAAIRVSVKNDEGQWMIWNYDEPLMKFMSNHKRTSLQIRERETPVASGPVMIKLLAAVGSTHELQIAEIDISSLLHVGTAQ